MAKIGYADRLAQHRQAVITLAHQSSKRAIKRQLRAQGIRINDVSAREIAIWAEFWFTMHRHELIAEAEHVIATSPYFERWRLPVSQSDSAQTSTEIVDVLSTTSAIFRGSRLLIAR